MTDAEQQLIDHLSDLIDAERVRCNIPNPRGLPLADRRVVKLPPHVYDLVVSGAAVQMQRKADVGPVPVTLSGHPITRGPEGMTKAFQLLARAPARALKGGVEK